MLTAVTAVLSRSKALTLEAFQAHPAWAQHLNRYPALRELADRLGHEAIFYVHSDFRLTGVPADQSPMATLAGDPPDPAMLEDEEWKEFCLHLLT